MATTAPAAARRRVAGWLHACGWPRDDADDLVLAVSEAVSNSVEHGYGVVPGRSAGRGGAVLLSGCVDRARDGLRAAVITVSDHGRWVPPQADGNRRRGLPLMRAVAEQVRIRPAAGGTTVELRSRAVPAG